MREFGFELKLCAHLELQRGGVVARQLGGGVDRPASRIVDVVHVGPGPDFERRQRIGPSTIPQAALEADVGIGTYKPVTSVIDAPPERARAVAEQAVAAGFFERERQDGRTVVRRTTDYPDWFGTLTAIENKPDLTRPGSLSEQLRFDIALGLFDRVVLATADHVTGAHLNRLPDAVGVWRFDPEADSYTVIRDPSPLGAVSEGTEIRTEEPLRTAITPISAGEIATARRRVAERAWGKGWRTYSLPECANCDPNPAGVPACTHYDRVVDPVRECGADCPGHDPGVAPDVDLDDRRATRTAWEPDPAGMSSRQSNLEQF